ncbi:MAG: hypothetical protein HUJ63_09275, partial [Enterococcus sp.]|nr:hypothetical protein [Enterococcus sp.]
VGYNYDSINENCTSRHPGSATKQTNRVLSFPINVDIPYPRDYDKFYNVFKAHLDDGNYNRVIQNSVEEFNYVSKVGDKYYQIYLKETKNHSEKENTHWDLVNHLYDDLGTVGTLAQYGLDYDEIIVKVEQINASEAKVDLSVTFDDPYKAKNSSTYILCTPFADCKLSAHSAMLPINVEKYNQLQMMINMATTLGGTNGFVADLQILPYCPVGTHIIPYYDNGWILNTDNIVKKLHITKPNDDIFSILYWVQDANYISTSECGGFRLPEEIINRKVENECTFYRLNNHNYNGAFDFNPVQNNGVNGYTIEMTCKPYTPYINVCPMFGGIYGKNYQDARGMIGNGNYTATMVSDEYANYVLQNKNFQLQFNRQ